MSQSYVIKVSASVRVPVSAKDRRVRTLVLTEILPRDELVDVLRAKLQGRGWKEREGSGGRVLTRTAGKVEECLDLADLTVTAEVALEKTVARERTIMVRGDRDLENVEERRRREQERLESSIAFTEEERAQAQAALEREITDELEASEAERARELNEVVREVYAEALKRKASRLGSVTEVREGRAGEDYELVIKVTQ